jgi:alanine racemase
MAPLLGVGTLRRIDRALSQAGLPPLERSAWVEVDVDALIENAGSLRTLAEPAALGPVVKADGYGHGLEVAARCAVAGGAEWLCVADASEAIRLSRDGYRGRTLVLYPVPRPVVSTMAGFGVDVTVGSVDEARSIADHLHPDDPTLAVHLEIDTGMTRGGVAPEAAVAAARATDAARSTALAGTWTHLAAPEDRAATEEQLARFESALTLLGEAGIDPGTIHVAASGGLLTTAATRQGLVRPGLAFYGVDPGVGAPLPPSVTPTLAVRAHPVRLSEVRPGTAVGYAGTWVAERSSLIATLPIGYADGWSRSSSPGTSVLVEGRRAGVVGRVSSDSLTVDVTDVDGVGSDSEFTLLGRSGDDEVTADEVAGVRGTISWEVLQQLGSRLARVYLSGTEPVGLRRESVIAVTNARRGGLPGH